jgi:hypothetical protein
MIRDLTSEINQLRQNDLASQQKIADLLRSIKVSTTSKTAYNIIKDLKNGKEGAIPE